MRTIEWNHTVQLIVTERSTEGDRTRAIVAKDLTPYQLDDLQYVMNNSVLNDFLDLRMRRTICEVLNNQPDFGYVDIMGLKHVVLQNLQPFNPAENYKPYTIESEAFNKNFDSVIDRLRAMGVVNCDYDPEQGYAMSGV